MVRNIDNNFRGIKHGYHGTLLYNKWRSMRSRVSKDPHYVNNGINCCDAWSSFSCFKEWVINNNYVDGLTLDRIDTTKGYSPDNCRWTTMTVQAENQRIRKDNTTGFKGVSLDKRNNTYKVQIQVNKKKLYLGRYRNLLEAAIAFDNYVTAIGSLHRKNFTMFNVVTIK